MNQRKGFKSFGAPQGVRAQKHGSNHTDFAKPIKNKALHVKKISVPTLKQMGTSNPDTIRPGSTDSKKFAPKSNAYKSRPTAGGLTN
jgi:hypothetical protein